jgi:hypothetical protein
LIGEFLRRLLGENQSLKATIAAALALGGGTIGFVTNGKQFMDMLDGSGDAEIALAQKAVETQKEQASMIASAVAENEATKADARAWAVASTQNTIAAYDFYLANYPKGLFVDQATKAKADIEMHGTGAPFALAQVPGRLVPVVQAARAAKERALARLAEAEVVAAQATSAVTQARARASGYRSITFKDVATYEGQVDRGKPNGVGVMIQTIGDNKGDKYAGAFIDGRWHGLGAFEAGAPGDGRPKRYTGEFQDGRLVGAGLVVLPDGARAMGAVLDGRINGTAALILPDGSLFEGEFQAGKRTGLGVLWAKSGKLLEAGRYADDALIEAVR